MGMKIKLMTYRKNRKAAQKPVAVEPRRKVWNDIYINPYYECPRCGRFVPYCEQGVTYCSCCGQALLWE